MPVGFGFSAGDFLAVAKLISNIISSLSASSGSASAYQELLRELTSLQAALAHVDRLRPVIPEQEPGINAIKCAALMCRHPLLEFREKTKKYDEALGMWGSAGGAASKLKGVGKKAQWEVGMKAECKMLREVLCAHVGTINMFLMVQGLEVLSLATERADSAVVEANAARREICEQVVDARSAVERAASKVETQEQEIHATHTEVRERLDAVTTAIIRVERESVESRSLLQRLTEMTTGSVVPLLKSLIEMAANVFTTNMQIYNLVLKLYTETPQVDTRHTWFQAPMRFEDALGRILPVPSEYNYSMLQAIIKERFKDGPGRMQVIHDDYEIFNSKNSRQLISDTGQVGLMPGMSLTMAIIVTRPYTDNECCPMPHCISREYTKPKSGGNICSGCGVYFDKASRKRRTVFEVYDDNEDSDFDIDTPSDEEDEKKTPMQILDSDPSSTSSTDPEEDTESMEHFKNIRVEATELGAKFPGTKIQGDSETRVQDGKAQVEISREVKFKQLIEEGKLLFEQRRYKDAEKWCQIQIGRHKRGEALEDPPMLHWMINYLGIALFRQEKLKDAVKTLQHVLSLRKASKGGYLRDTLWCMEWLAYVLWRGGEIGEAKRQYGQLHLLRRKVLGPHHPDTVEAKHAYIFCRDLQKKYMPIVGSNVSYS